MATKKVEFLDSSRTGLFEKCEECGKGREPDEDAFERVAYRGTYRILCPQCRGEVCCVSV